jgi:serine/threonine protein kinase
LIMLTQEQESLSGQQIGNYEIVELITARKASDLYLARDVKLERLVYLEVLRTTADEDTDLAARFQRRMETVSQLKHENIALVSDIDTTEEGLPYAVMEYFPATTLAQWLAEVDEKGERLPVIDALRLGQQLAQALSAAHSASLIHHDLRPENIMLREDGSPVLLDLGVPFVLGTNSLLNKTDGDTLHYASPEEMEGKTIGRRSNIYSLGIILYELLAGHRPRLPTLPYDIFPQANMPKEEPLEEAREGLAGETYRLVRNCLWRQEWSRFETADEMITAIETAILAEQDLPKTPAWSGGRRRSLYALMPLALVAVLVIGFFAVRSGLGRTGAPPPTEPATAAAQGVDGTASPTPTLSGTTRTPGIPLGNSITMVSPATNDRYRRSEQINFFWTWPIVLNPDERFTVYILDGEQEYALESVTEPANAGSYRLTVDAEDIPTEESDLAWQVRLEGADNEPLVTSNSVSFVLLPSTPTATRTPTERPTGTVTLTATASPTPTTESGCIVSPPPGWTAYIVQRDDSVAGLAEARGVTPELVMAVNCLEDDLLSVGQQLFLPAPAVTATPTLAPVPPTQPPSGTTAQPPDPTSTNVPNTPDPGPPTETPTTEVIEPTIEPTPTKTAPPPLP